MSFCPKQPLLLCDCYYCYLLWMKWLTEFFSYTWRKFIGKESSHVLDTANTFFYSALKFLTYRSLFLFCLVSLSLSCPFPPYVSVCVHVWWFKSSYIFISSNFWLLLNWCDQQITPFKNDVYFVSYFLVLFVVCSLLLPPMAHLVLCWWSLDAIFLVYSCTLTSVYHEQCLGIGYVS